MDSRNFLQRMGLAACLSFCVAEAPADSSGAMPPDVGPVAVIRNDSGLAADWFRQGPFMEILVRSYQDSNNDGIGDLRGLISRLDYLQALGIRGIWLMPIYPSADHDHGYAVVNYRGIDPDFGTLADFDTLLREAHRRGIGVILDYVMNHSAATHPLFIDSQRPDSPWRSLYVWESAKPQGWNAYGGDPWHAAAGAWYYSAFDTSMPDFNFKNPQALDFHLNNLKFWLNRGVDGFRFDAAGALVENGPLEWENQPQNHAILHQIKNLLAQYGKRYMVAEAPGAPSEFSAPDSAGSAFAFGLQSAIIESVTHGRAMPALLDYLKTHPVAQMGTFLSNHDTFAGARVFRQLDGDEADYRMAAATLLTLPGIPFIYYGEEIGQGMSPGVHYDDQALRGPMSWDAGNGFSSHAPYRPPADNKATYNVAQEQNDPASLLSHYRTLIRLRADVAALAEGDFKLLSAADAPMLVFLRSRGDSQALVAINYSGTSARFTLEPELATRTWKTAYPASGRQRYAPNGSIKWIDVRAREAVVLTDAH
ncbi:alpha-amylase family glycosyl hydrolase [Paludibacterium yongneupense]|uniref:alpha-amylase family glycosyl hydrolase n=1 Tax=Paludibacterium yongneupense TaxID=400061 RepID=UPI0003FDB818|nr:alpha-amylase family glycosyl hydrolase [Paludibacterium yongneupense]